MRFQFYDESLKDIPKLSVDGTVPNSVHFSHWNGNETPAELKADTSTEIVLNLVASPNQTQLTQGIDLVTNNHFDTDGLLSVWTALAGERALEIRDELIAAAEAGDFSEFRTENAARASIVIQGPEQAGGSSDTVSPLARQLSGKNVIDDSECYDILLPHVERVITSTDEFEILWRDGWDQIERAFNSFDRNESTVEEFPCGLSLVSLSPRVFGNDGFVPEVHPMPSMAIARHARGHVFLITTQVAGGWYYALDYPYYSWADTVVRAKVKRRDFGSLLEQLNQLESISNGRWQPSSTELSAAVKFLDRNEKLAVSTLPPDVVAPLMDAFLQAGESASLAKGTRLG